MRNGNEIDIAADRCEDIGEISSAIDTPRMSEPRSRDVILIGVTCKLCFPSAPIIQAEPVIVGRREERIASVAFNAIEKKCLRGNEYSVIRRVCWRYMYI